MGWRGVVSGLGLEMAKMSGDVEVDWLEMMD